MSYTRVNWNSTTTYVSAENLNVMDKGIKDLDTNIGDVTTLTTTAKTVVPAIEELKTGLEVLNNNLNHTTYQGSNMNPVTGATVGLVFTKYNFGLVTVKGYIMLASSKTVQEAAITLPNELKPSSSVCTSAYVGVGGDFTNMQAFILADGKLNLYASAAKDLYYINTAYSV